MMHHPTRTAFGQILGHPTKPHIRFFFPPPEGEGAGGGSGGGSGSGEGGEGGAGGEGGEGALSAEDAKAIRKTSDKAMRERNEARDALKPWTDLGITLEEAAAMKAERDAKAGGPTPEQIQKDADKRAETAAREKFSAKARSSELRSQAAALGFHDPTVVLALLDPAEVAKITVDDELEADGAAAKKLLEALATKSPYLVKPKEGTTVDYRTAGIGGTGSSSRPETPPGTPRLAAAYAANGSR